MVINYVTEMVMSILIPIIQMLFAVGLVLVFSTTFYFIAKRKWLPKALISQVVYFNYSLPQPVARIDLSAVETQWQYSETKQLNSLNHQDRFMHSGEKYDVNVWFNVAKSSNNYNIGKFTATLKMVDNTGDTIAISVRPVVIPYQSPQSVFLDSLFRLPLRYAGLADSSEAVDVFVPFMNDFHEPPPHRPATDVIEISLSTNQFDLMNARLTVMPILKGIS